MHSPDSRRFILFLTPNVTLDLGHVRFATVGCVFRHRQPLFQQNDVRNWLICLLALGTPEKLSQDLLRLECQSCILLTEQPKYKNLTGFCLVVPSLLFGISLPSLKLSTLSSATLPSECASPLSFLSLPSVSWLWPPPLPPTFLSAVQTLTSPAPSALWIKNAMRSSPSSVGLLFRLSVRVRPMLKVTLKAVAWTLIVPRPSSSRSLPRSTLPPLLVSTLRVSATRSSRKKSLTLLL